MVQWWTAALLLGAAVSPSLAINTRAPFGKRAPSPDVVTNNIVPLRKVKVPTTIRSAGRRKRLNPRSTNTTGTTSIRNYYQLNYVAEMQWGNKTMYMILDTGSSDTWVLRTGYECLDSNGAPTNQTDCTTIAPTFSGDYTGGQIDNVNFYAAYGSAMVTGTFGWEDITIAGLTVPNAQVAVVDQAFFESYNASGIFGMAFQSLTSEYPGSNSSQHPSNQRITYEPIFYRMVDQGLSLPTFTFAPQRGGDNGYLAFGGIPPVNTTGPTVALPILTTNATKSEPTINQGDYYTISVDNVIYGSNGTKKSYGSSIQAIMDTGTSGLYLPNDLITSIANSFTPPARYQNSSSAYSVPCNATAPKVAFTLGGVNFNITSADLISALTDPNTGYCLLFLFDGGSDGYILGDSLLNNLLTTFDLGAMELRVTALA